MQNTLQSRTSFPASCAVSRGPGSDSDIVALKWQSPFRKKPTGFLVTFRIQHKELGQHSGPRILGKTLPTKLVLTLLSKKDLISLVSTPKRWAILSLLFRSLYSHLTFVRTAAIFKILTFLLDTVSWHVWLPTFSTSVMTGGSSLSNSVSPGTKNKTRLVTSNTSRWLENQWCFRRNLNPEQEKRNIWR